MSPFYKLTCIIFILLAPVVLKAQQDQFTIEAGPEYRREDFRWSIAGTKQGTNPNILSELIFKPINAAGFFVKGQYKPVENFSVDIHYNKLWTYKGSVTDFDYDGDNRTNPVTKLYLQSNEGGMRTAGMDFNYQVYNSPDLSVLAGAGLSLSKELFYLTDDLDPLLRSTYEATWNGPGLHLKGLYNKRLFNAGAALKYSYLFYNATADWNLVETFQHPVSFTHKAKANAFDGSISTGVQATPSFGINLHGLFSFWKTGYGVDKLYETTGVVYEARLNGAIKKSFGLRLTGTFTF